MPPTLQSLSEDALISRLKEIITPPASEGEGIGDDCAVLPDGTLLKTDCVIENVHYLPETLPEKVGRKAVARVISDMAAMGGRPLHFLITIGLKAETLLSNVEGLYKGMDAVAVEFGGRIIGGETTTVEGQNFISVSGVGIAESPVRRSGARVGDGIYVTGVLGGSFPTEHHLTFTPRVKEAEWILKHLSPTAMIDLSDGLARDLPRVSAMSKVGYTLDLADIPVRDGFSLTQALEDGEDYELLFTAPPEKEGSLKGSPFQITRIGEVTADTPQPLTGGWDHLGSSQIAVEIRESGTLSDL